MRDLSYAGLRYRLVFALGAGGCACTGVAVVLASSACRPVADVPPPTDAAGESTEPTPAPAPDPASVHVVPPPESPLLPILGCWTIVRSEDPRYPLESQLCIRDDHVAVREPSGELFDAWFVDWTRESEAWRGTVPVAHTWGFDVQFFAELDGEGLTFRSGGGLFDVGLGDRRPDSLDDGAQRHSECLTCIDAARAVPAFEAMLAGPPYALRSCEMFVSMLRSRDSSELPDACREDRPDPGRPA